MGATTPQRQAADAAETLAAIVDRQLDLIGLLALQPAIQRREDLITQLENAAIDLVAARQIIFAWRRALQREIAGP